jgi:glycosyltransferase involved in cell wall biosynthesis
MIDVTAVLTCHAEGLLLGPAIASFQQAVEHARANGISVEQLVVLDRGDALTKSVLQTLPPEDFRVLFSDCGDPGQARNYAAESSTGEFVTFLDGDDLWSSNWITSSYVFSMEQPGPVVCHSEANVVFGGAKQIWWHVDSEAPDFQRDYLLIGNYWDAMCFVERNILKRFPFRQNELSEGYGHEDWHWNCLTLGAGIPHRPVPGTLHFKRRRRGSQMTKCEEKDVVTYETDLTSFSWEKGSIEYGALASPP